MIISQNALEWPVGTAEVHREQLNHLLELSEQANYDIRVVPRTREVGAYLGLDGSFTRLTGADFGEAAYTESPEGGRTTTVPADIAALTIRFKWISAKALPDGPSRDLMRRLMEEVS